MLTNFSISLQLLKKKTSSKNILELETLSAMSDDGVKEKSGGGVMGSEFVPPTSEGTTFSPVKTSMLVSGSTIRRADALTRFCSMNLFSRSCNSED